MAPFRWKKIEDDLALCKQYVGDKPDKPSKWDKLASTLSALFNRMTNNEVDVNLTGRGCREHLDLLVKKYKSEERAALKRYVLPEE